MQHCSAADLVRRRTAFRGPRTMTRAEALHRDLRGSEDRTTAVKRGRNKSTGAISTTAELYDLKKSGMWPGRSCQTCEQCCRPRLAEQMERKRVHGVDGRIRMAKTRAALRALESVSHEVDWIRKPVQRNLEGSVPCIECCSCPA